MLPTEPCAGHGKAEPWLPPGFRFHPTDEELVTYYLAKKLHNHAFDDPAITEIDLNNCEPWDLPAMAKMGEKEWYFYTSLDRKYPTGMRTNRATRAGYWKATGKDREVLSSQTKGLLGMKKTLVFYKGRAPKGEKTNWVMHEYRLEASSTLSRSSKEELVVCRVFQKAKVTPDVRICYVNHSSFPLRSLPPLLDSPLHPMSEALYHQLRPDDLLQFMRSPSFHPDTEEPHLHCGVGESSRVIKGSSYLQPDIATVNSQSYTTFNETRGPHDDYHQPLNTVPHITQCEFNSDIGLPWDVHTERMTSTMLKASSVNNASKDEEMDVKSNPATTKFHHSISENGFLLEELLQGYEEPISNVDDYYPKQYLQHQASMAASSELSEMGGLLPTTCREKNVMNRRLTGDLSHLVELEDL